GEGRRYPDWTSTIGHEGARDRGGHGQALALRFANLLRPERPRPADLADPGEDLEGLAWIGGSEVLYVDLGRHHEVALLSVLGQRQPHRLERLDARRLEIVDVVRVIHVAVHIDLVMADFQTESGRFSHDSVTVRDRQLLRREERDDLGAARRHDDLLLDA